MFSPRSFSSVDNSVSPNSLKGKYTSHSFPIEYPESKTRNPMVRKPNSFTGGTRSPEDPSHYLSLPNAGSYPGPIQENEPDLGGGGFVNRADLQ